LPLRVGFSADAISPERTGVGRYAFELATRLPQHPAVGSVTLLKGSSRFSSVDELLAGSRRRHPLARRASRLLGRLAPKPRYDVVHGPNYTVPEVGGHRVVTVHDLSVFRFPETHPAERVAAFERDFRTTVDTSDHLITDCETIREEVISFTGLPRNRVTAVPLGVSSAFRPQTAGKPNPLLAQLGLPGNGYGLTVSSLEPRKRIDRLLIAWRSLPLALRRRHPLVIAGAAGWRNEALHSAIENARDEGWVVPLGFVPEEQLPQLYAGASLFIYPSVYEGFGLPPVEAMASGVPALVAGGSCLAEVTRGAAMLVDPDDTDAFVQSIVRALEDEEWRRSAISSGIQVAAGYTWEACVDKTVDVYQRVVSGAGSAA
jgi:alpha-1,3-rhamnosyl/mannosyltransferase